MLHIVHTSIYDAWAAYDAKALGTRFGAALRQPPSARIGAHKMEAVSYAAWCAASDLLPTQRPLFDALMLRLGYDPRYTSAETSTPAGIGNTACAAVLAYRHYDGSNQLGDLRAGPYSDYTGYKPVNTPASINDPNRWQPLAIPDGRGSYRIQTFMVPFWGQVKPFALQSGQCDDVKSPAAAGTRAYREQADQVLAYSADLTDRHKAISEYWADGPGSETPPGHWNLLAQIVSRRDAHGIDEDVKMFFALNGALMDAGICAWQIKRRHDYVRPITAIHHLYGAEQVIAWAGPGRGTHAIAGASWRPYQAATMVTPPFAEYVSGHSTFSAAAAAVLRRFTGSNLFGHSVTIEAGSSRVEPGLTPAGPVVLHWPTFSAAADEAGLSRRYGGIHFQDGDLQGRRIGKKIGRAAYEMSRSFFGQGGERTND